MNRTDKWLAIFNPNAGNKKGLKDQDKISRLLDEAGLTVELVKTKSRNHAISITNDYIEKGYRKFMIIGGDGTLNEVVNGIFNQKNVATDGFLVAMIPVGTGNDWCRSAGVPNKYRKAIKLINKDKSFVQDVGKVCFQENGKKTTRFFVNVAGMGYDAIVAAKTNRDKDKGRSGALLYLKNLFTALLFYKHSEVTLHHDDRVPEKLKTFSLSVGIGKYNGGGMKQLPAAVMDDGIFNVTLIKKLSKFTVIKEVKNLYDGSFINHPKVATFEGKRILIESNPSITLEVDGETMGESPFDFEIFPKALRMIGKPLKNE